MDSAATTASLPMALASRAGDVLRDGEYGRGVDQLVHLLGVEIGRLRVRHRTTKHRLVVLDGPLELGQLVADHGKGQLVDQILARARGDDVLVVLVVLQRQRRGIAEMGDLGLPVLKNTTTQLGIGVRNVALERSAQPAVLTAERVLADNGAS